MCSDSKRHMKNQYAWRCTLLRLSCTNDHPALVAARAFPASSQHRPLKPPDSPDLPQA